MGYLAWLLGGICQSGLAHLSEIFTKMPASIFSHFGQWHDNLYALIRSN